VAKARNETEKTLVTKLVNRYEGREERKEPDDIENQ